MSKGIVGVLLRHAEKQGAVLSRSDALRLGADRRLIARLLADGVLVRRHPGVYLLGGRADDHGVRVRAAIVATRRLQGQTGMPADGLASHRSAAWLQGLTERAPMTVELTVCGDRRRLVGVSIHQVMSLPPARRYSEIPCTLPARTLVDLAPRLSPTALADAVDRAVTTGILRITDLDQEVEASAGRRGVTLMRQILADRGAAAPTASALESRMGRLLHAAGIHDARPEHRVEGGRYRIDYAFPGRRSRSSCTATSGTTPPSRWPTTRPGRGSWCWPAGGSWCSPGGTSGTNRSG